MGFAVALGAMPARAAAQYPGELAGRVTEAGSGASVEAATVELPSIGRTAATDGTGAFRIRGLEPGSYRVLVRRTGYAAGESTVEVRNGEAARLSIALHPLAVALGEVHVTAAAGEGGTTIGRDGIEASGARSVGDVLARAPGVLVRETGAGGAQTASIRGSAANAVLVLVDGVALNDPVTGAADLSTVPAQAVQSVTVLPGAQSARYGPGAEAGVILVRTRAPDRRRSASASAGTLGEASGGGEWGGGGRVAWSGGFAARRLDGAFTHPRDADDPTPVRRTNADVAEWSAFASAGAALLGGDLRARGGWEALDRGVPGLGYAPSVDAREAMHRGRASLSWLRSGDAGSAAAELSGVAQSARFRDPAPPFGLAYDTRTTVRSLHGRVEAERLGPVPAIRAWGAGAEATSQRVDAGGLSEAAPRSRTDAGAFAHASTGTQAGGLDLAFTAAARADRDALSGTWHGTRALTAEARRGGASAHLANRSSFSPPSLGDQFFREGVGVAPNPDLRPERVPSEWEAGVAAERTRGAVALSAGASAYRGDVRGMIVWMPDYRFVWSPRNTDVKRKGVDLWAEAGLPRALRLSASWSLASVTYDREGEADTVQVAYRPRSTGHVRAAWSPGPWRLELGGDYVGRRNPDPSPYNALPGFWTLDAAAVREWRAGRWRLQTALRADRLRGERDALIAGYPEPGRRLRVDLRIHPAERP
jgi:vitamin B12 transporter